MTEIKNVSNNSNVTTVSAVRSALTHSGLPQWNASAKLLISKLNDHATKLFERELGVRDATFHYVSALVDCAHEYAKGEEVTTAFMQLYLKLFGKNALDNALANKSNPYNFLVRAADGEWLTIINSKGTTSSKWSWNRSGEKYAAICRFAVLNNYSGKDVLEFLQNGDKEIPYKVKGKNEKAKPTINGIIAADKDQNPKPKRDVLKPKDWEAINSLKPIAEVEYTNQIKSAFTLSEGGLGMALVIVRNGKMEIIGDAGVEGNPILRRFKEQREDLAQKQEFALKENTEVADLDEELVRDAA